jgi:DtxR family transcriptional regulator, Mn-dependent transcriptional regulator
MTNKKPMLTAANIRYLLVIRELDTEKRGARCTDAAKILGVTKPSVTTMIRVLRDFGLVTKEKYGAVHLTEIGREKAAGYAVCYEHLLSQFEEVFGPSKIDYRNVACTVLAGLSEEDLMGLRRRIDLEKQ